VSSLSSSFGQVLTVNAAILATMQWPCGATTITQSPKTSSRSAKQCMFLFYQSEASLVGLAVVCTPYPLYRTLLNLLRHWIRLPCQSVESFSIVVSHFRFSHFPRCSTIRSLGRESPLPRPCIRAYWTGLWVPLRMFPLACRRGFWSSWPEHELGLHDIIPCHQREYFQLVLRACL
jgi:hypothetical protein